MDKPTPDLIQRAETAAAEMRRSAKAIRGEHVGLNDIADANEEIANTIDALVDHLREPPKLFPIAIDYGTRKGEARPHPMKIPWHVAELAYTVYVRDHGGRGQSLERVAERGGFYASEMDMFLPDWRERCEAAGRPGVTRGQLQAWHTRASEVPEDEWVMTVRLILEDLGVNVEE